LAGRFVDILVDPAKLRNYVLSDGHARGRHKARVFRSRLGLSARDTPMLRTALLNAARDLQDQLLLGDVDAHGQRYVLDFPVTTEAGTTTVRSAWIVLAGEDVLRFLTCYVL